MADWLVPGDGVFSETGSQDWLVSGDGVFSETAAVANPKNPLGHPVIGPFGGPIGDG